MHCWEAMTISFTKMIARTAPARDARPTWVRGARRTALPLALKARVRSAMASSGVRASVMTK